MVGIVFQPGWRAGPQNFIQTLQRLAAVAVGVDANLVAELSTEQPVNGGVEPVSKKVPERGFNPADGVVDDSRNGTRAGRRKVQLAKQSMNVARVFSEDNWFDGTKDRRQARRKKAFTKPLHSFVSLNPDEGPIKIAFNYRSFQPNNFHRGFFPYLARIETNRTAFALPLNPKTIHIMFHAYKGPGVIQ
jgi:hypothetical protein